MKVNRKAADVAMARACMTAADVARKASVPEQTVKNALYGRTVRPRTAGLIARALGVDVAEIIENEPED